MCKHANAFVLGFFRWAVNLNFSTIKSKFSTIKSKINYLCKILYSKKHGVLIWHCTKIWMILTASRLASFEITNPWKGRSVHLQLDGDINPSKNSWMRKCNIFDCKYTSYPIEILDFTFTFEIEKFPFELLDSLSPKLFNSF